MRKGIRIIYSGCREFLPETWTPIFSVLSLLCLRTSLEVHAGISLGVQVGTLTGFERKELIQDGEQVGNGR